MSQEREVTVVNEDGTTSSISASEAQEKFKDSLEVSDEDFKKSLFEVLDRGWTSIRLQVDLPDDLWGEWIPKDIDSIARAQKLGFRDGSDYAAKRALHSADGLAGVGDTVFMVTSKHRKKLINEVQLELYKRRNDPKRNRGKGKVQEEETDASKEISDKIGLPVIEESNTEVATKSDIEAALKS